MISSFKAAPECNPRAVLLGFCTDRRGNQQLPNSILVMLYRVWFFHSSKSRFLRIPEYKRPFIVFAVFWRTSWRFRCIVLLRSYANENASGPGNCEQYSV
nr:MAG TPA: hypothetical protein [Caudoviricetes sp.]